MAGAALVPFGRDVVDLRAAAERGLAADAITVGKPPPA